jgi:hypothetical protein
MRHLILALSLLPYAFCFSNISPFVVNTRNHAISFNSFKLDKRSHLRSNFRSAEGFGAARVGVGNKRKALLELRMENGGDQTVKKGENVLDDSTQQLGLAAAEASDLGEGISQIQKGFESIRSGMMTHQENTYACFRMDV